MGLSAGPLNLPNVSRGASLATESPALGVRLRRKALRSRARCKLATASFRRVWAALGRQRDDALVLGLHQ